MKLLDRVRDAGLRRRLAASTIACYQSWINEFLRFSRSNGTWRRPGELFAADVERYLNHLARDRTGDCPSGSRRTPSDIVSQVQSLLGHASLETTMIYTHVMNRPAVAVTSPLDRLASASA